MARASKRLIISAEEIVDTEQIRRQPTGPLSLLSGGCRVRVTYGSHPGEMVYQYARDEAEIRAWLRHRKLLRRRDYPRKSLSMACRITQPM
jgi:hypothetical protein